MVYHEHPKKIRAQYESWKGSKPLARPCRKKGFVNFHKKVVYASKVSLLSFFFLLILWSGGDLFQSGFGVAIRLQMN